MAQLFLMFAVLCCIPSALVAIQPYTPQYENPLTNMGRWTEYPELSGKGLRCLEIDDSDTVWFGTETGIYSYDGLDWKEYPISDDLLGLGIDILVFAGDGSLYAGSNVALSKLQEGAWERVLPSSPDVELPITGICPTGFSGLWISTPRGVLAYNGDVWRAYADSSGTAWLGENTTSIKVHTVPELSIYEHVLPAGHPTGVAGPYREFNPIGLLEDSNGRIWLGQALGDVHSFNVDSNGAPYDWVNHSMVDGFIARGTGDPPRIRFLEFADEVWVVSGTHDPIIAYKNGVGRQVDLRSESNHPGTNLNTSAMINADGSIWVAGFQLQIWQDGAWTFYGPRGAPKNALPLARRRILSMAQARDGSVWFAQRKGNVFRLKYNSNQWTTYADLFYCGETRSGLEYFLEKTGRVIEHDLSFDRWVSFGTEDGVMEFPKVLHLSSSDLVWLAGTHGGIAATANLVDGKWFVSTHPTLSWSINGGGAANTIGETSDGTLWFPGTGWFLDENTMSRFSGGIKTFNGVNWELLPWVDMWGLWKEYRPLDIAAEEGTLRNYYGFGQDIDGQVWMGTVGGLYSYENRRLRRATHPQAGHSTVQVIRSTTEGILWVGTRAQGVFTFDGKSWTNHGENDGLVGDNVRDLVEGPDESIWVSTTEGLSRYDGSTWTPQALFPHKEGGTSRILINERGHVFQSHRSGAWGVRGWPGIQPVEWDSTFFSTIRYIPDGDAPETEIVRAEESVSVEGNKVIT
ncbi:MAG: hypothetical protein CME19_23645, partial [Gemmatimonadetes bacterium]|nr:hypothetical protein [Gemmatimonadota bacterium]